RVVPIRSSKEPDLVQLPFAAAFQGRAGDSARAPHPGSAAAFGPQAENPAAGYWVVLLRKGIRSYQRLCFEASYKITAVAIAEFNDSTAGLCGIRSTVSQYPSSSAFNPLPSFPMSTAVGARQSHFSMLDSDIGDVPTKRMFLALSRSTNSRASIPPACGSRNRLPALARTPLLS